MARPGVAQWILASVTLSGLAGCFGSDPAPSGPQGGANPHAATPVANATAGAIRGLVLNDEEFPIRGVEVALAGTPHQTRTDGSGAFTFNDLEAGTYNLLAQALGYEPAARKVEVQVGEVVQVKVLLVALAINEPYTLTIPRTGHVNLGHILLTDAVYAEQQRPERRLLRSMLFRRAYDAGRRGRDGREQVGVRHDRPRDERRPVRPVHDRLGRR